MDFQFNQGMEQGMEKGIEVGMEKGIEVGMEKGIEVGMEKGIEKEKENFAKLMKMENEPIDKIVKFTGLSKEKIEAL